MLPICLEALRHKQSIGALALPTFGLPRPRLGSTTGSSLPGRRGFRRGKHRGSRVLREWGLYRCLLQVRHQRVSLSRQPGFRGSSLPTVCVFGWSCLLFSPCAQRQGRLIGFVEVVGLAVLPKELVDGSVRENEVFEWFPR